MSRKFIEAARYVWLSVYLLNPGVALLNPGDAIALFQRNDCSISPVEVISGSGVRTGRRRAHFEKDTLFFLFISVDTMA